MRVLIASPFRHPNEGVLGLYAQGLQTALQAEGGAEITSYTRVEKSLPPGLRHIVYGLRMIPGVLSSDMVLALDTWSVGFPALVIARIFRRRFFIRIGGDFLWESYVARTKERVLLSEFYSVERKFSLKERVIRRGIHLITKHADALLFTTRFQRDIWQKAYGFKSERAHIVENYFPPKAVSAPPEGRIFVSAGRKIFLKNKEALDLAFAHVQGKAPDISLDMRSLPYEKHLARLDKAYAVIIPAFSEVCSNTAIEAVAHGKPFIMTRDTGTSERLEGCGIFIDTRSQDEIERALEEILLPEKYESCVAKAKEFSFTHSWETIGEEILSIRRSL